MRLMIDTNIILDVIIKRQPFYTCSRQVLKLCENKEISGFVSASSITDLYYIIHKYIHDNEKTYGYLGYILDIVKVLPVTNADVLTAFQKRASDFEDCLLATCAKTNQCDGIVTRNADDYKEFEVTVYSPEDISRMYSPEN